MGLFLEPAVIFSKRMQQTDTQAYSENRRLLGGKINQHGALFDLQPFQIIFYVLIYMYAKLATEDLKSVH